MESIRSKEESHEEPTTVSEWSEMALPGFRFHPTEEELVGYYLRRMVQGRRNSVELIASLDLYQYDPWELPAMAFMGEKEWFFFCPRDKKYPNGARPNRVTASGYWKATGTDRPVRCSGDSRCIGLKKTLVFYTGRAPRGNKTEWIMNEYRMPKPAERSISVMTSGVNSISYSFSTYDNFVIKNDVALCRIYRKSSSALNSVSFISAIGARDLEERTSRMMSRFENNPAAGTQQQHHNHVQRLQGPVSNINVRVSSEMPMASLSSAAASSDNGSGQQQSATKAASMVTVTHSQLVDAAETQRQQQQQQQLIDGSAQGSFDHGVSSMMDCSTTSEEASRQLQIALRTAMAKLDGVGSSTTVNFNDGESLDSNGSGIFGRFRSRLVQDAGARPSASVMRSPSPEAAAAVALNHNRSSRVSPTTAHEHFSHPLNSSRDIKIATTLLRSSSSETVAVAFSPIKNDPTCTAPRVSIQSSFSHHVNSSPSTNTTSTTTQCVESAGGSVAPSAIAHHTINNNNCSNLSPSSISQLEGEVQSLVNACSIPPLSNTYSLKRSRFTRVQPLGGEHCPMAKMPSVAQYWRQSSSAPAAAATAAPQLSTFDALSGLTFEY